MFVHLHNHSYYSLLDGLTKIDELVARAKEDGSNAVALTDHGVLYGAVEFYQKAKKAGVKPIIGVEAYMAPGSRHDKFTKEDARYYHLVLLAKNNLGYQNLIQLVSLSHLEGFYYKPRMDWELLEKYHEGLIALSACMGGEIPQLILAGNLKKAKARILEYSQLFGKDNYYLEIMDHPKIDGQLKVNEQLIKFSKELGIPLVATNDVHYFNPEDAQAQDILLCLQNKKKLSDKDRMSMLELGNFSMRSAREMKEAFKDTPEAISNTLKIAERCNWELKLGETKLPHFDLPAGKDANDSLRELCEQGLKERYALEKKGSEFFLKEGAKLPDKLSIPIILERLEFELATITKMGWPDYFLIVADFVNWAKDQKIVVGPGRGSAAGSLVCYLTKITNLDPLVYDLLFERFLNPDRVSMPDIDMDFADTRRADVLDYVASKYGKDHVAQIITFGTMAARAAVRDVGRVLGAPYDYCDKISKSIPMFSSLDQALENVAELKEIYKTEALAKEIIDYAKRLEGVPRHSSTHACGVLITPQPLTDYVPIQYASSSDKTIVSQYSLHPLEDLGLLKMDFLGLKNLSTIESALNIIKNTRGLEIDIDKIPLNDELALDLFRKGETTGVFQFESSGMRRYLRELKPSDFEDIIAMVALYRPGPMEWIPDYIAAKHGKKKINYLHPKLEPILAKTNGVAIYQEQVIQISRDLAGLSPGEADVLRKAMGKKIPELLAQQKEKFIDGSVKNSISANLAKQIFAFIEPFAGYGFNRSHAACYAMIAYQTAYLKAHWPSEFMAALLSSDNNDNDRIALEIEEARKMGLKILPPNINESFANFTVLSSGTQDNELAKEGETLDTIRFGLGAIKNLGEHIVLEIINERKKAGPFLDIFNFLERITDKDLNKKSFESLIKSGALEDLGGKAVLLANLEKLLNFSRELSRRKESKQETLFSSHPEMLSLERPKLDQAAEISQDISLVWEKELLGLYVSDNPLSSFAKYLRNFSQRISALNPKDKDEVIIAGVITGIKKIITKQGQAMLFVKLEDQSSSLELIVFPKTLEREVDFWQENKIILVSGNLSEKDYSLKLIVNQFLEINKEEPGASIDEFKKIILKAREENFSNGFRNGSFSYKRNRVYRNGDNLKNNNIPTNNNMHTQKDASLSSQSQAKISSQGAKEELKNTDILEYNPKVLRIVLSNMPSESEMETLKEISAKYKGKDPVHIRLGFDKEDNLLKTAIFVNNTAQLREELRSKLINFLVVEPRTDFSLD